MQLRFYENLCAEIFFVLDSSCFPTFVREKSLFRLINSDFFEKRGGSFSCQDEDSLDASEEFMIREGKGKEEKQYYPAKTRREEKENRLDSYPKSKAKRRGKKREKNKT